MTRIRKQVCISIPDETKEIFRQLAVESGEHPRRAVSRGAEMASKVIEGIGVSKCAKALQKREKK